MYAIQGFILENLPLLIAIALICALMLYRFYMNYNSLRERRKRVLIRMLKNHIESQYIDFDEGTEQLESALDKNLTTQLKKAQQTSAVPDAVLQAARSSKPSQEAIPVTSPK